LLVEWLNGLQWRALKNVKHPPLQTIKPIRFNVTRSNYLPMLLIEPNELLPINSLITIYLINDDFDEYLATAKVTHIQDNKLIQTQLVHMENAESTLELAANNAAYIRKLKVRPIVTDKFLVNLGTGTNE
jgi:hypothetical protein